ncbi:MAG: hypothetical protein EXR95_09490 [Gemmatimonadetes bacterium]|nr:hypothetical protein [Gemmatimonadota bacterium]
MPFHLVFDARARLARLALIVGPLVGLTVSSPLAAQQPTEAATQQRLDSLAALVGELQQRVAAAATEAAAQPPVQARAGGAYMNVSFVGLLDAGWSTEPDVGAINVGDHDPAVRGFSIPNAELALDGTVDPYFLAFANVVYKLDAEGETGVELEEMFFLTTSLPGNLQLKGGQFFTEFGRQNPQHPHSWAFADQPLVLNRMFGPDGLRSQGVRIAWLAPTPWYTEAMLTVANSAGETASSFRSEGSPEIHGGAALDREVAALHDLLFVPHVGTSFDLTNTQTLLLGAAAAFGPNNSGPDASTRIHGVDLYWKWKSATARQGFPFLTFQAEALSRRYDAAERAAAEDDAAVAFPAETLRDRGLYAQLQWGIKPLWVAGLRGETVSGNGGAFDSELRADRSRVSPNLTWFPTEFSKTRLQYNYDHRNGIGSDHSLWLQIEFLLGAHAAHKF